MGSGTCGEAKGEASRHRKEGRCQKDGDESSDEENGIASRPGRNADFVGAQQ
jgi:hypothetical protein